MAMTCITGGKECTGCMACKYADYIIDDEEEVEEYDEEGRQIWEIHYQEYL